MSKKNLRRRESNGRASADPTLSLVQPRIAASASKDFEFLVDRGCQPNYLRDMLQYLTQCPAAHDTRERLTVFPPQARETALDRMHQCAQDLKKLSRSRLSHFAQIKGLDFAMLANQLEEGASLVESVSPRLLPRRHIHQNLVKAFIVSHVMEKIGRPHDRQVSSLISATMGTNYDEVNHAQWRRDNLPLIDAVSRRFKNIRYAAPKAK